MRMIERAWLGWHSIGPPRYWLRIGAHKLQVDSSTYNVNKHERHELTIPFSGSAKISVRSSENVRSLKVFEGLIEIGSIDSVSSYLQNLNSPTKIISIAHARCDNLQFEISCKRSCGLFYTRFNMVDLRNKRICYWQPTSCKFRNPGVHILFPVSLPSAIKRFAIVVVCSAFIVDNPSDI